MSDDKIRAEFEGKFPVPAYVYWCAENNRYMSSGNPLSCIEHQGRWDGWQAAQPADDIYRNFARTNASGTK